MSVLEWMDVIYFADVLLCASFVTSKISYRLIVRGRLALIPANVLRWIRLGIDIEIMCWSIEFFILSMLAVMTGENPILNIDEYRFLVAWARAALGVGFLLGTLVTTAAIWAFLSSARLVKIA